MGQTCEKLCCCCCSKTTQYTRVTTSVTTDTEKKLFVNSISTDNNQERPLLDLTEMLIEDLNELHKVVALFLEEYSSISALIIKASKDKEFSLEENLQKLFTDYIRKYVKTSYFLLKI